MVMQLWLIWATFFRVMVTASWFTPSKTKISKLKTPTVSNTKFPSTDQIFTRLTLLLIQFWPYLLHIIQGLVMKAINNPRLAGSDPILIQKFPDPYKPTSLDPQFTTWISQFGSVADLRHRISIHIQSRFFKYWGFNTFSKQFRRIIWSFATKKMCVFFRQSKFFWKS